MTDHQRAVALALGQCSFLPASAQKRFCRDLAYVAEHSPDKELSPRQAHYMQIMAWRYRRQMPAHLVPAEKPADLPPPEPKPSRRAAKKAEAKEREPELALTLSDAPGASGAV